MATNQNDSKMRMSRELKRSLRPMKEVYVKPPPTGWFFNLVRHLLFKLEAEKAHELIIASLRKLFFLPPLVWLLKMFLGASRSVQKSLRQELMGLHFPVPIGLAAGFDKNGLLLRGLHGLGFGFAEVGTVTLLPQPGNPKPRLWREHGEAALINSLGFNNQGAELLAARLRKYRRRTIPIGVNIGKNRDTPLDAALGDYQKILDLIYPYADYLVINVSSPNTPGLRDLQKPEQLKPLLNGIVEHAKRLAILNGIKTRPLLVKLAPELADEELKAILEVVKLCELQGVVATNTMKTERGGKSGKPLFEYSLRMVREIREQLGAGYAIIGVGGVSSAADAMEILRAGANLVQVYTGLIYQGPGLVPKIHRALAKTVQSSHIPNLVDYLKSAERVSS